jgi:hypothetical protein
VLHLTTSEVLLKIEFLFIDWTFVLPVETANRDLVYDARVFIAAGPHSFHRGNRVRCRITAVEENVLQAIARYCLD